MSMPMPMLLSPSASSASETESDADTDADVDPTQVLLAAGTQSRLRRRPAVAVHPARQVRLPDAGVPGTTLFCGAEIELGGGEEEEWWDAHRPAVPRFLPDDSEVAPPPQPHRVRKSTGCGARVHASAHSARAGGRWVGAVQGVEGTVVRLESGYFAERDRAALGIAGAGCGCNIEGVGCAIWYVSPLRSCPPSLPLAIHSARFSNIAYILRQCAPCLWLRSFCPSFSLPFNFGGTE
ncbi:hypothetical protein C8R46DRAFT_390073 [Mycena filopes]|nr:hypothetical protein C8R46DRAFT_390073 [Mycena filopes]